MTLAQVALAAQLIQVVGLIFWVLQLLVFARVFLCQRVPVSDIRALGAVQQHVHAADAEHRVVEVEPVEHAVVEMLST